MTARNKRRGPPLQRQEAGLLGVVLEETHLSTRDRPACERRPPPFPTPQISESNDLATQGRRLVRARASAQMTALVDPRMRDRLCKLLGMCGSSHDGEVSNAARMAD